jgi:hypothetical protein
MSETTEQRLAIRQRTEEGRLIGSALSETLSEEALEGFTLVTASQLISTDGLEFNFFQGMFYGLGSKKPLCLYRQQLGKELA